MHTSEKKENNEVERTLIIDGIEVYHFTKRFSLEYLNNEMTRDVTNIQIDNPKLQIVLNMVGERILDKYQSIFEEVREVILK